MCHSLIVYEKKLPQSYDCNVAEFFDPSFHDFALIQCVMVVIDLFQILISRCSHPVPSHVRVGVATVSLSAS